MSGLIEAIVLYGLTLGGRAQTGGGLASLPTPQGAAPASPAAAAGIPILLTAPPVAMPISPPAPAPVSGAIPPVTQTQATYLNQALAVKAQLLAAGQIFIPTLNAPLYVPITQTTAGAPQPYPIFSTQASATAYVQQTGQPAIWAPTTNPYLYAQVGYPTIITKADLL